jgi:hypothetical protein
MRKHIPGPIPQIPIPPTRIAFHELEDKVHGVRVKERPPDITRATLDLFVEENRVGVWLVVWRKTREHFEDEDAEGVPVDGFVVSVLADYLMQRDPSAHRQCVDG